MKVIKKAFLQARSQPGSGNCISKPPKLANSKQANGNVKHLKMREVEGAEPGPRRVDKGVKKANEAAYKIVDAQLKMAVQGMGANWDGLCISAMKEIHKTLKEVVDRHAMPPGVVRDKKVEDKMMSRIFELHLNEVLGSLGNKELESLGKNMKGVETTDSNVEPLIAQLKTAVDTATNEKNTTTPRTVRFADVIATENIFSKPASTPAKPVTVAPPHNIATNPPSDPEEATKTSGNARPTKPTPNPLEQALRIALRETDAHQLPDRLLAAAAIADQEKGSDAIKQTVGAAKSRDAAALASLQAFLNGEGERIIDLMESSGIDRISSAKAFLADLRNEVNQQLGAPAPTPASVQASKGASTGLTPEANDALLQHLHVEEERQGPGVLIDRGPEIAVDS